MFFCPGFAKRKPTVEFQSRRSDCCRSRDVCSERNPVCSCCGGKKHLCVCFAEFRAWPHQSEFLRVCDGACRKGSERRGGCKTCRIAQAIGSLFGWGKGLPGVCILRQKGSSTSGRNCPAFSTSGSESRNRNPSSLATHKTTGMIRPPASTPRIPTGAALGYLLTIPGGWNSDVKTSPFTATLRVSQMRPRVS